MTAGPNAYQALRMLAPGLNRGVVRFCALGRPGTLDRTPGMDMVVAGFEPALLRGLSPDEIRADLGLSAVLDDGSIALAREIRPQASRIIGGLNCLTYVAADEPSLEEAFETSNERGATLAIEITRGDGDRPAAGFAMARSPCVGLCDLRHDVCRGCGRTLKEIARWVRMTEFERTTVNERLDSEVFDSVPTLGRHWFQPKRT